MVDSVSKKTLLIVDDLPDTIDILFEILGSHYDIRVATNGEKAWKMLQEGMAIDLCLSDIDMPVMNGYELCQKIKEHETFREIPLIFITASQDNDAETKGFELGASDFITKPFSPSTVQARIKAHITLHEKTRDLCRSLEDLQRTQDELLESKKMASLGSLAAGVAHELNTPLGIAVTATSILLESATDIEKKMQSGTLKKSEMSHYIAKANEIGQAAHNSIQKAAGMIENFKAFSLQNAVEEHKPFNLCELISETVRKVQYEREASDNILHLACDHQATITSSPEALRQVLTQLMGNALDHAGGDSKEVRVEISSEMQPDHVNITIKDNGQGIPQEELQNIFQPFYTTKRIQGYSGLGLSTVHNLVYHKLNGKISVTSEVGQGTSFTIELPMPIG